MPVVAGRNTGISEYEGNMINDSQRDLRRYRSSSHVSTRPELHGLEETLVALQRKKNVVIHLFPISCSEYEHLDCPQCCCPNMPGWYVTTGIISLQQSGPGLTSRYLHQHVYTHPSHRSTVGLIWPELRGLGAAVWTNVNCNGLFLSICEEIASCWCITYTNQWSLCVLFLLFFFFFKS